jgi:hypothetical protein
MLHSPVLWVWRVEALQHFGLIGDDDDVDAILRACLAGFFAFCRDLSSSGSGNDPIADIGSAKSMGRVVPIADEGSSSWAPHDVHRSRPPKDKNFATEEGSLLPGRR